MLTPTDTAARGLADLDPVVNDSLLALIALANADPRADKIDVGVGVFRDAAGNTPILKVIKEAEQRLVDSQVTKAYLGSAGDKRFAELLRPILLGHHASDDRIAGLQTPGGCGALRLGFELIATANPQARVLVGTPTWPNHPPIIEAVRLERVDYPYYERVGSLWVKTGSVDATKTAMAHVHQRAREMWSMPPDHGAAAAHIILEDPELRARWLVELTAMRDRINAVRQRMAAADPRLAFIGRQFGMFSMLPLSKEQVLKLRQDEAIYMADSRRFNVVGMGDEQIDRFIAAVVGALDA